MKSLQTNSSPQSLITNQIHLVKDQILSYQTTLKKRYDAKLLLLNKNLTHLQHKRDKFITECQNIKLSKVAEDAKITEEEATIKFLVKENLSIQDKINSIISRIKSTKLRNQQIHEKSIILRQVLAREKRKLVQMTNAYQELVKRKNTLNQQKGQNTRRKIVFSAHQSPAYGHYSQQANLLPFVGEKSCINSALNKNLPTKLIHQCHKNLMRNQTVKRQLKIQQNTILKQKQPTKQHNFRSSSIIFPERSYSDLHVNSIKKFKNKNKGFSNKILSREKLRLRSSQISSLDTWKKPSKNKQSDKVLTPLDIGFKFIAQAFPQKYQSNSEGLDNILLTTQNFNKFEDIQNARNSFRSIDFFQLVNLIVKTGISDQVLNMIEMDKLSTVQKYEKFKRAHLRKNHRKLKL